jgi:hypothetical protein
MTYVGKVERRIPRMIEGEIELFRATWVHRADQLKQ